MPKYMFVLMYADRSILGVFSSGKKLADAAKNISASKMSECVVHCVDPDKMYQGPYVAGYDHQGTMLNEFLHTPLATMD